MLYESIALPLSYSGKLERARLVESKRVTGIEPVS